MTIPEGWQQHPENPAYMWNPTTNQVSLMPQEQPPPPVLPPAPEQAVVQAQSFSPEQMPAPAEGQGWGTQDLDAAAQDLEEGKRRSNFSRDGGNFIYIDFPRKLAEESIFFRFLPPWARDVRKSYLASFRHRIYARLVPDPPENRDFLNFDCLDLPGGPGNCGFCATLENNVLNSSQPGADDFYSTAKKKPSFVWQGLDVSNPNKHFQSLTDAQGQEYTGIVPGLIRMGPMLHNDVLNCFRNGDFTHHEQGYPVELVRKQTGDGKFDVKYHANHLAHHKGSIDPSLVGVLHNLVDLSKEAIIFTKPEKVQAICQNIISYYGGAGQGAVHQVPAQLEQWTAHPTSPGWEYNAAGAVRQIQAPVQAAPAIPPAPAQIAPVTPPAVAPAALPPAAPPAVTAAPTAGNAPPLPPAAAPGLATVGNTPPVPPVAAPGMPPSVAQNAPVAPVPMSPGELQHNTLPGLTGPSTGAQQAAPPLPPNPGAVPDGSGPPF